MICSFWVGESRDEDRALIREAVERLVGRGLEFVPARTRRSTASPTSRQTLRVTSSLSPVRIFTRTPAVAERLDRFEADSLGGSKKAM